MSPLLPREPTPPPSSWGEVYQDPTLPLIVDLGTGPGRFPLLAFKRHKDTLEVDEEPRVNFLGLEIREPLVERAKEWAQRLGYHGNVHYLGGNASISLRGLLETYPGTVKDVYIQFPDPHFKKKHRKRRIFQPSLVYAVRDLLPSGGRLYLTSDVLMTARAMRNAFEMLCGKDFALAPQHLDPDGVFFTPEEHPVTLSPSSEEMSEGGETPEVERDDHNSDEDSGQSEEQVSSLLDFDTFDSAWASLGGWLRNNPIGIPTEREHHVNQQKLPIYRLLCIKK
jgi:tRNA (guanine-N7-)-methyltransferase